MQSAPQRLRMRPAKLSTLSKNAADIALCFAGIFALRAKKGEAQLKKLIVGPLFRAARSSSGAVSECSNKGNPVLRFMWIEAVRSPSGPSAIIGAEPLSLVITPSLRA
jgi:hypothetical protein